MHYIWRGVDSWQLILDTLHPWSSRMNCDTSVDEMRAPLFIQPAGVLILECDEKIVHEHRLRHARVAQVRVHG